MTKKIVTLIVFIVITFSSFSQTDVRKERIKSLKIAFITERLDLNANEAQKFWPIYNAFQNQKDALRRKAMKSRKGLKIETISETQAEKLVQDILILENKKYQLQTNQINELLKIIPAKKVLLLKLAEEQFNKRMLQEIKKRRQKFRNKN